METPVVVTLIVLVGLLGVGIGYIGVTFGRRLMSGKRYEAAQDAAATLLKEAREEERKITSDAKGEAGRIRSDAESKLKDAEGELRERRSDLQRSEQRLSNREENADRRADNLDKREGKLADTEKELEETQRDLDKSKLNQVRLLEELSDLSMTEAKDELMARAEEEISHELSVRYRDMEDTVRAEAQETARNIIAEATQRLASDVTSEVTLTSVPLPNDEMKGRVIGREGRNIRAIEKATGVDLIIDDTPEAVTLSCFDPIRREVARLSLTKLIADGRIHPARIEETVARTQKELDETIRKTGQTAVMDSEVRGLNPEVTRLLGQLKYRFSYGENVLQHSLEVGWLAAMMAGEIGVDVKVAKAGGLLHDIGKALTHEVEGPHAEIGAEIASKNRVSQAITTCIKEHHDDVHTSPESFNVAAADAISAARPGARRDTVEHYIKRLEALEEVGSGFDGVEKCFAIQAGREVRIMVKPEDIDDDAANDMAREVVRKIEKTLSYPGQIKVTVIRESRAVDYAR